MVVFIFAVLDQKYLFFLRKFGPKVKIVSLSRDLVPTQFKYAEYSGDVHFFRFRPEISYLGKFGPNNQNCQFKLEIWYLD